MLEWDFVSINVGLGSAGFFFNETGLQYNGEPGGFLGWLGKQLEIDLPSCLGSHGST